MLNEQAPLPAAPAWRAVARCVGTSAVLLSRRQVHLPRRCVGARLIFADGSVSWIYRETVVDRPPPADPCVLVVRFRLFAVRGWGHHLFRWESLLNTPLFVGFPGLVSKLWLAADATGTYRGVYEWDGGESAQAYARALWRVLALVSEPESIQYQVLPGLRRSRLLAAPGLSGTGLSGAGSSAAGAQSGQWWRPVRVVRTRS